MEEKKINSLLLFKTLMCDVMMRTTEASLCHQEMHVYAAVASSRLGRV